MSGHSKWATIKHKKGKLDAQRGKLFSKIIRELTTAARIGGGDPNANPRLRTAVETARAANMPGDTLERAIKKGTGELPGQTYEEVEYEGYGPAGVAVMVKVLSDNKNRTTSEIRHIFAKHGGNLGATGCVAWQFHPKGVIVIARDKYDEDTVLAAALEAGAEDVRTETAGYTIITTPADFESVKQRLAAATIEFISAELTRVPSTTVALTERDAEKMLRLYEALEEQDDVQAVYANFDIADEIMEKLSGSVG